MDWIEIKTKEDLPKQNCWVKCKLFKDSTNECEIYFEVEGGYGWDFLMNQSQWYICV